MKKGILLLACLTGCSYNNLSTNIANVSKLEEYRYSTIKRMRKHTDKHPTCFLNNLYSTIETTPIQWFNGDNHTPAYFYKGIIYLNKNFSRNSRDAVISILHELMHTNNICGDDVIKTKEPICHLFGKPVYYSTDITKHIEDHLKEY